MRVLMVTCQMLIGGAEMMALELLRALHGRGCRFVVAAIRPGGALKPAFAATGARIYDGLARGRFDPLAAGRIARIIRQDRIDAVVIVDVPRNGLFYGLLGAALSGRRMPRLCWCGSRPDGQSGNFAIQLRGYLAAGMLDAVVVISRLQRRMLVRCGLPRRRMPLLRNGVDLERFAAPGAADVPLPRGKHVLVQVANVMPDKDFDTLLPAAARLAARRDDFHLLLVGRGTDSPQMARRLADAGLKDVVTAVGCRNDVPAVLAAADAFVLSTRREVFSVVTLEALAAGLPVVVPDIPAFREMFAGGREGLKVRPGDPAALADALDGLLDDPAVRRRLGAAGRRRAARFTAPRMARTFLRLLRSIKNRDATHF